MQWVSLGPLTGNGLQHRQLNSRLFDPFQESLASGAAISIRHFVCVASCSFARAGRVSICRCIFAPRALFSSGKAEERGFTARKFRCAESDYRRRFFRSIGFIQFVKLKVESQSFQNRALLQVSFASCLSLTSSRDSGAACTRDCGCDYSVLSVSDQHFAIL